MSQSLIQPSGASLNIKRMYAWIVGNTLDLKISHKTRVLPNQIKVIGRRKNSYIVQDNVYGNTLRMTYYEIARYYLGRNFNKRYKFKVSTYQIVSNPVVKYSDLYKTKFDIVKNMQRK